MTVEQAANPPGAAPQPSPEDRLAAMFGEKPAPAAKADPEEADEPQADADEPEEEAAEGQADEPETEAEPESTDAADETADIEIDGEVYSVPKKIEGAFLKERDYRQKTAEVAEQRRALDERTKFIGELERVRSAVFDKAVAIKAVENQLARFDSIDWHALARTEGTQFNELRATYDELMRQHQTMRGEVQTAVQEQEQLSAKQRQQLIQQGNEELTKHIKGWSKELGQKLFSDTKTYGFTDEELAEVNDPRYVRVLHDAYQWRELQKSKTTIVKKKIENAKPVTVKAARSAQTNQANGASEAARARLKKTGSTADAEEALYRMFDRGRKR